RLPAEGQPDGVALDGRHAEDLVGRLVPLDPRHDPAGEQVRADEPAVGREAEAILAPVAARSIDAVYPGAEEHLPGGLGRRWVVAVVSAHDAPPCRIDPAAVVTSARAG